MAGRWTQIRPMLGQRMGYAPGWQVRCRSCGRTRDAADVGITRWGAHGTKYTLGRCSACDRWRIVVIERVPGGGGDAEG